MRFSQEQEEEEESNMPLWPKGKYGNSYGGMGNTAEEARENGWKEHLKSLERDTKREAKEEAKRQVRMETYKPQLDDISGNAKMVVVSWLTLDGERVSAYFKMSSWAIPPLSVRAELMHKQRKEWEQWQARMRTPQKKASRKKAAKTPPPAQAEPPRS
jgi:hypothetical protein